MCDGQQLRCRSPVEHVGSSLVGATEPPPVAAATPVVVDGWPCAAGGTASRKRAAPSEGLRAFRGASPELPSAAQNSGGGQRGLARARGDAPAAAVNDVGRGGGHEPHLLQCALSAAHLSTLFGDRASRRLVHLSILPGCAPPPYCCMRSGRRASQTVGDRRTDL